MEQVDKRCLFCEGVIPRSKMTGKRVETRKYCSTKCRNSKYAEKGKEFGDREVYEKLSANQIGALHEILVCADLIKKGYMVYREILPGSCDLAVVKNKTFTLIEVTSGWFKPTGELTHTKKDRSKFDVLAVVTRDGKIHYLPPLEIE